VHLDADGTANVALWAEGAHRVELCVFDDNGEHRIDLPDQLHHVFHGRVSGVPAGTRYGFRVHGPWHPERGKRWNPHKLLLDPYARAIDGDFTLDPAAFDHIPGDTGIQSELDSARVVPRSVVVDDTFDWGTDRLPQISWSDTVIYETHVRGLTMTHPELPEHLRGTFAGLAHPAIIEHLTSLGVTTIELLPVHHFVSEVHLLQSGLTNYWGYNTVGFFAPHARYSAADSRGGQVSEFKDMVKALHAAGLEVVIDVVYNHTAEGGIDGPTLSFRGIGNDDYYYLTNGGREYVDYTGCGNSLDASHPHVLQMILDSLRYWATEMHVDGFRFDLTSTLARSLNDVNMLGNFMTAIQQDPVLRRLKLIAEPWDVGPGGYRVGEFPVLWAEWNDRFRDTTRSFWRGDIGLSDLGYRLTGSADLYAPDGRRPFSSINFVTAHDGFTLRDLVTYEHKHNQDNGEDNRDGTDNNISANYGHEGETDDPAINEIRHQQVRNMLLTCVLSSGVPMLSGGDEIGRTQRGNNNAYCQDNEISWYDWNLEQWQIDLLHFTRDLITLRRMNPAFRQRHFYVSSDGGDPANPANPALDQPTDITWWHPNGRVLSHEDWNDTGQRCLGMIVANWPLGSESESESRSESSSDEVPGRFLVAMNAGADAVDFRLPEAFADAVIGLHTTTSPPALTHGVVHLPGRSSIVLTHP
jgi:glycogen operon protein